MENNRKVLIIDHRNMESKKLNVDDYFVSSGSQIGITEEILLGEKKVSVWIKMDLKDEFNERFEKDPEFAAKVIEIVREQNKDEE